MMDTIIEFFQQNDYYYLKLLSIPIVSGSIGWFTNWQAIQMTFYPINFWGIKIGKIPIGWQGIIPANGAKMADITVDLMTQKLISVENVFERLNPDDVAREMGPQMKELSEKVVTDAMMKYQPNLWKNTPQLVKNTIFNRTAQDIPDAIRGMMQDVKDNINELMNLKKLCVEAIIKDKTLINEIFLRCGSEEFKFIEVSGWWFGLIFGIPQMLVWHFFPLDWTLPVAGVIVGYATNWLALKLIFSPKRPIKFLFWTFIGLFIKRQKEVSAEYGKIIAERVLNSENLWEHMLNEKGGERMYRLIETHINNGIEKATDTVPGPIMNLLEGTKAYSDIKELIVRDMVRQMPSRLRNLYDFTDKAFDIEGIMREKLQALPPEDFVGVLRPAFEEEEFKLILVGAILGGLAGLAQLFLVFGTAN
jgi:uncharacterized membrane protein YheB (UPF0754 family)